MFYIEKLRRHGDGGLTLAHIGPTAFVFVAFMILTVWSSIDASNSAENSRLSALERNNAQVQTDISQRMSTYEDVLRSGVGLFSASDVVSRSEWQQFVDVFKIDERYPGVQGVGYIDIIPPDQLVDHINAIRADGSPEYNIRPEGERLLYTSVVYIEPQSERNVRVLGYDLYSEPKRRTAMEIAKNTGNVAVTDIVRSLILDNFANPQPGFLMFVPIYEKGTNPKDEAERNTLITGYVYGAFRSFDFLSKTIGDTDKYYGLKITNDSKDNELLYMSDSFNKISQTKGNSSNTQSIRIYNQTWKITGTIDPSVVPDRERNRAVSVLWGGALFSAFVAGFIFLLLQNRSRVLAQKEEREVQEAKDELLALASHQLRTPATGVKQYIGMLREGYVGRLTKEQHQILDKAYSSNERQLATINEMLSVARADAGNINLDLNRFDLAQLLRTIIDEQTLLIRERQQNLTLKIPRSRIYVTADPKYIRMAVENIINNATKYTPEKGDISISLKKTKNGVRFSVQDNGVGVSEKDYPLLFRKFSRIPNELTNKVSGSGIGLYLAKKVIEAHHGSIVFSSNEETGSTCTILLPDNEQNSNGL